MTQKNDEYWMAKALRLAEFARRKGEIPVGAILVKDDRVVSVGCNLSISLNDPSAHAEMIAIRRAGQKLDNYRLLDTTLYVTLEPCPMCTSLLVHSRVRRVVYGANDLKTGACGSVMSLHQHESLNHQLEVQGGVLAEICSERLSAFFKQRRKEKKQLKKLPSAELK
jgi:tRNA(adenine34) deaminase